MTSGRRFGLTRVFGAAFATIAIVTLLSAGAILATFVELRKATQAREHAALVLRTLSLFQVAMLDQETGVRGYLLTTLESSLEPYKLGRTELDTATATLRRLIGQETEQSKLFEEAYEAAHAWQTNVGEPVIALTANPATRAQAVALETAGEGKQRFDEFRQRLDTIEEFQRDRLRVSGRAVERAIQWANLTLYVGAGLVLAMCAAVGLALRHIIVQPLLSLADAMGRLARRDLDVAIPAISRRNEVGAMARAVEVFKNNLLELDRTSLLRATADTLPAMVGYIDARRRIGFLNGEFERWFDLKVADVTETTGRSLADVFPSGRFPGSAGELDAALEGSDMRFEYRLNRRVGGRRALEAFFRPHRAPGGQVLGVVTLLTDITDRKAMEIRLAQHARDLKRSNEELEQFAYIASHDLKAPLRGIDNLVTWIEEDLGDALAGDVATNMDLLKTRVKRLEALLDDLLAFSRAGRGEIVKATIDTKALVDELAVLVSPPPGFTIVGGPGLPTLVAAKAPLTQTLQNLISNAIKHHGEPATGLVTVDAEPRDDAYEFIVTDNGPGVPAQFRERVFGMFQTLRPRDEVEGSGMGLAIVKKLVERQAGKIWLADGPNGQGLAVHFTWPSGEKDSSDGSDREPAAG